MSCWLHKNAVAQAAVTTREKTGVGGEEAGKGNGQNAMGQLTCTEPSLTAACELNPALCWQCLTLR